MWKIERDIPQEHHTAFIERVFSPDLKDKTFFFLFNPVTIPENQDVYERINTTIAGIFLERTFKVQLEYVLFEGWFVLQIYSQNEHRAKEIIEVIEFYIDKALREITLK